MAWEPDYLTLEQCKHALRITDDVDNAEISRAITAASRLVDLATNRQFGLVAAAEARYYTPWYDQDLRRWVVEIDDLMTTTDLAVAIDTGDTETYDTTVAAAEYTLRPRNAVLKNRPWTQVSLLASASAPMRRPDSVRITARWGWSAVPVTIEEAMQLQMSRLFARRDSPHGVAGSPESGSEVRLLAKLDPDVEVTVKAYRRAVRP
jgi:hypothetical protein